MEIIKDDEVLFNDLNGESKKTLDKMDKELIKENATEKVVIDNEVKQIADLSLEEFQKFFFKKCNKKKSSR